MHQPAASILSVPPDERLVDLASDFDHVREHWDSDKQDER